MPAVVKPISRPQGAPALYDWRWICRDHDRLRVGRWGRRGDAEVGALKYNRAEHPKD